MSKPHEKSKSVKNKKHFDKKKKKIDNTRKYGKPYRTFDKES